MNSVVFTMVQHPGNTDIIDFTMNSIVSTMIQHPGNTYNVVIIDELRIHKSIDFNKTMVLQVNMI